MSDIVTRQLWKDGKLTTVRWRRQSAAAKPAQPAAESKPVAKPEPPPQA